MSTTEKWNLCDETFRKVISQKFRFTVIMMIEICFSIALKLALAFERLSIGLQSSTFVTSYVSVTFLLISTRRPLIISADSVITFIINHVHLNVHVDLSSWT